MRRKDPLTQLRKRLHSGGDAAAEAVLRPNPLGVRDGELVVFAYGSNMLSAWIRSRAPEVRDLGMARLEGFLLRWNKRSKDGSAKCSIEETGRPEHQVWGVLYGVTAENKVQLDAAEGLGGGYADRSLDVQCGNNKFRVRAYYATSIDPNLKPYDWYRDLVIAGAREHGLPVHYIVQLEAVEVILDEDAARMERARHFLPTTHG